MKSRYLFYTLSFIIAFAVAGCEHNPEHSEVEHDSGEHAEHAEHDHEEDNHAEHEDVVTLTKAQFNAMNMQLDTLKMRKMNTYVETNGVLEVPPQNEASVTTIIGANVTSIKVIEGDKVNKGQVLANISHPDLIKMQMEYISKYSELNYLEQDYNRKQRLLDENVGSGKEYQKTKAEYLSTKGMVKGLEAQLKQLGMSTTKIQNGDIYETVPVISPISGNIRLVNVKTGQFVQPQTELFGIVNIDHIHADFMVFEKDIYKVKENQEIRFKVESGMGSELTAKIYSVGQAFEENPKAVHIHAEINQKSGTLLPGMYVRGKIFTDESETYALPDDAIVRDADNYYIFSAVEVGDGWEFTPITVKIGVSSDGFKEITPMEQIAPETRIAWNNAYYLYAEMKKGEAEHSH